MSDELDTLQKIFEAYRRDYISTSKAIGEIKKWAMGLLPKELRKNTYQSTTKYEDGYNQAIAEIRKNIEEGRR